MSASDPDGGSRRTGVVAMAMAAVALGVVVVGQWSTDRRLDRVEAAIEAQARRPPRAVAPPVSDPSAATRRGARSPVSARALAPYCDIPM